MRKLIESFNPSWGAAVMGTGVLSIILAGIGGPFAVAAYVLFWLNSLVLLYALICWALMWFLTPAKIKGIVDNANQLVFLPTVPVGVVVYANNLLALRGRFVPSLPPVVPAVLWLASSLVILALSIHFIDRVFDSVKIEIRQSTFGWLIPPVALLIIPLGAPGILDLFGTATARTIVVLSFAVWGAGFFAYLFVNAAVTHRYFFHEMPANQMIPSVWVGLGPVGAGAAGLLSLSKVARTMPDLKAIADLGDGFALLLWGSGIVWYLLSLTLTLRKTFFEKIPYTMGWWAFTFPLGAHALATRMLFVQTGIAALRVFFWLLLANLIVFWLIAAYRTARFVFERLHAEQAAGVTQKGAGSAHYRSTPPPLSPPGRPAALPHCRRSAPERLRRRTCWFSNGSARLRRSEYAAEVARETTLDKLPRVARRGRRDSHGLSVQASERRAAL